MSGLLIRDCELLDGSHVDVRVRATTIAEVGCDLEADGEHIVDGRGGALIPGLHDHHIHLLSLAASLASVRCGPPAVRTAGELAAALRTAAASAPPGWWIRGFGYHESVAGELDRRSLDALVATHPVRIQHRSGALWMLNSAALAAADLESTVPDGRLFRSDAALRARVPQPPADLAEVGRMLTAAGVTGVTDATPDLDRGDVVTLEQASRTMVIPQKVTVLGAATDPRSSLSTGPHKIILDEARGLDPDGLEASIDRAHSAGRSVAIHCVTVAEVLVAIDSIGRAGARPGDRLEHASELPRDVDRRLCELGLTVVTQPNFVAERGDDYLAAVEARDHDILYRCGTLVAEGIAVAAGTDAPFGDPDPWRAMRAAVDRETASGQLLGPAERITPSEALNLFLGTPNDPGGRPRVVAAGAHADLCLLHTPTAEALATLDRALVRLTVVDGVIQET